MLYFIGSKIIKNPYKRANFIIFNTEKTTDKEMPLCVPTDNGIALPCPYFVLSGIAWAVNELEAVNENEVNDLA